MEKKIRVFLCKPGLDGHDRGVLIVGQALREAGMEVIYSGLKQTNDMLVEAAIQEDADVFGISILSGAHMALIPRITEMLAERGADDILVIAGGVIPSDDADALVSQHGVDRVFGPGTDTRDIVAYIREKRDGE
ncbi:MAG TPA: cobalamin B12-binding domain-containing protein [Candidatus Anoxymicrobiaceae bacterium]